MRRSPMDRMLGRSVTSRMGVFGGADTTGPTVTAASFNVLGTQLTITFSEAVNGHTGFTITPTGGASTLTYLSGDGTTSKVYTLSRTVTFGETATLAYTPGNVTDLASNPLLAFSGTSVANSSTVLGPPTVVLAALAGGIQATITRAANPSPLDPPNDDYAGGVLDFSLTGVGDWVEGYLWDNADNNAVGVAYSVDSIGELPDGGVIYVRYRSTTDSGSTWSAYGTGNATALPAPSPPVAEFTGDPLVVVSGQSVCTLTADWSGGGDPVTASWKYSTDGVDFTEFSTDTVSAIFDPDSYGLPGGTNLSFSLTGVNTDGEDEEVKINYVVVIGAYPVGIFTQTLPAGTYALNEYGTTGGGGGGTATTSGGGSSGRSVRTRTMTFPSPVEVTVTVGAAGVGGVPNVDGTDGGITSLTASGLSIAITGGVGGKSDGTAGTLPALPAETDTHSYLSDGADKLGGQAAAGGAARDGGGGGGGATDSNPGQDALDIAGGLDGDDNPSGSDGGLLGGGTVERNAPGIQTPGGGGGGGALHALSPGSGSDGSDGSLFILPT